MQNIVNATFASSLGCIFVVEISWKLKECSAFNTSAHFCPEFKKFSIFFFFCTIRVWKKWTFFLKKKKILQSKYVFMFRAQYLKYIITVWKNPKICFNFISDKQKKRSPLSEISKFSNWRIKKNFTMWNYQPVNS